MNLMRRATLPFLLFLSTLLCAVALLAGSAPSPSKLDYPKAKTVDQVDDYHGTKIADPYRWLEDTDSADTMAWVQAENKLTFSYLDQIPYRPAIHERLTKMCIRDRPSTREIFSPPSMVPGTKQCAWATK